MNERNENKMKNKSFYDWCKENNRDDLLKSWDYDKNEDKPEDIPYLGGKENRYFKCPKCGHSYKRPVSYLTTIPSLPKCDYCLSFGVWCEEHERRDILNRWDYGKNEESPYDVTKSSAKKFYFKCPRGIHESEQKRISDITHHNVCNCDKCQSFGQWGKDNLGTDFIKKYWSDKNTKDPMKIWKSSRQKVWIKCQDKDYHPDYQVECASFVDGCRCPYCSMKKIVPEDSLGAKYPQSLDFWFQKNITPFEVPPCSKKKFYWKCEKHGLYRRSIENMVKSDFTCPKCQRHRKESSIEKKVRLYLDKIFGKDDVKHEGNCTLVPTNPQTGAKLRYDNEVVSIKLLI